MSDKRCTCGSEGVHGHQVDDAYLWLCGQCHSVFSVLRNNSIGLNLLSAVRMSSIDPDNIFDKLAVVDPTTYVVKTTDAPIPQRVVVITDPMYEPIPHDYHEVMRKPPEFDHDDQDLHREVPEVARSTTSALGEAV